MSARRQLTLAPSMAVLLACAAIDAGNTPAAVSILGYTGVRIGLFIGAGGITFTGTNKVEFKLRAGDGTVGNHVAVAATDVEFGQASGVGSAWSTGGIIASLIAAHATPTVYWFDYVNTDPAITHLSLLADFGGTHAAVTPMGAWVERYKGRLEPG